MERILLGESRFIFVIQIFLLLLIGFLISFFLIISIKFQSDFGEFTPVLLILILCFSFLIWKKVLSLNLVIRKDEIIYIKNLIREKEIHSNDILEVKISWLWLHGVLVLKNKDKFNFPLDGKHVKDVFFLRKNSEIINEYQSRVK